MALASVDDTVEQVVVLRVGRGRSNLSLDSAPRTSRNLKGE